MDTTKRLFIKKLDPSVYGHLERSGASRGGASVRVHASPYDVPVFVVGSLNSANQIVLEFHYLDNNEPEQAIRLNSHEVVLGKSSHRIMKLVLPLSDSLEDSGSEKDWFNRFKGQLGRKGTPELNLDAVRKAFVVIQGDLAPLQPQLAPA